MGKPFNLFKSIAYLPVSRSLPNIFTLTIPKATMHFSTVVATFALALGVSAIPQGPPGHDGAGVHQANNQHGGGVKACCLNKSTIQADGILSGLLTRGALKNILGSSDQACAEFHLIENLNILGFTKQGTNGECAG